MLGTVPGTVLGTVPGTALGCLTSARPIFLGWTLQPRQCAIATKEKVPSVDGKVQSYPVAALFSPNYDGWPDKPATLPIRHI